MAIAVACEASFLLIHWETADEDQRSLVWFLLLQGDKRYSGFPEQTWTIPLHPVVVWFFYSHVSWCIRKRANVVYARKVFASSIHFLSAD